MPSWLFRNVMWAMLASLILGTVATTVLPAWLLAPDRGNASIFLDHPFVDTTAPTGR